MKNTILSVTPERATPGVYYVKFKHRYDVGLYNRRVYAMDELDAYKKASQWMEEQEKTQPDLFDITL